MRLYVWILGALVLGALCGRAHAVNVIVIDPTVGMVDIVVTEDIHFEKPAGTNAKPWQTVRVRLTSEKSFAITWAQPPFTAPFGGVLGELPSKTTRSSAAQFGFQWNPTTATWEFIATTQGATK